jgi:glutamine amidotransferase
MASTVIIDYGVGNVGAVANMIRRIGGEALVSRDAAEIRGAERIILPGVGAFDRAMEQLVASGVVEVLDECVLDFGTPLLGICVGMQILARGSEEGGRPGLGWIDARVQRFRQPVDGAIRIPQMGWNRVDVVCQDPLVSGFEHAPCHLYFLHSYHMVCDDERDVIAWTVYGNRFPSIVRRGNVWGVQGHPEKSHRYGMSLFRNFLKERRGAA